jgi:histidine triad (HIT) family protein
MTITNEQAKQSKEQLLKQIDKLPKENQEQAKKQIETMTNDQMEEFVKQNQLTHLEGENTEDPKCIFCAILEEKMPSIKIAENEKAIAVLDINPISKGHALVIPKDHNAEPDKEAQELAFKVGGKIFEKFKPKDMTTRAAKSMDHTILNVIPLYEDTDLEKRTTTKEEELKEIAKEISDLPSKPVQVPTLASREAETKVEVPKKEEVPVCMFCAIANNKTPSIKIDENKDNIAILEINPVSIAHTLVIPKNHTETTSLPTNTFTLAKKIAKKIKTKFKPNDVKLNPTSINNHSLIELIPIYDGTDPTKREKASEADLKKVQKKLLPKKKSPSSKTKTKKTKKTKGKTLKLPRKKFPDLPQMSRRIP